jgi:hypothetical protein
MKTPQHLWATAGSLPDIATMIRRFYCQPDTSQPVGAEFAPGCFAVCQSNGAVIQAVQVRKAGRRYRFENRAPDAKPISYQASYTPTDLAIESTQFQPDQP